MVQPAASTFAPDAIHTLRDSYALHLGATRADKTMTLYLGALDALVRHLEANGMPTAIRAVRREHIESFVAARRELVKPSNQSSLYETPAAVHRGL